MGLRSALIVLMVVASVFSVASCTEAEIPKVTSTQVGAQQGGTSAGCDGADCHADLVSGLAASKHAPAGCLSCHPEAEGHPEGYEMASAAQYFQMEACGSCHPDQLATYAYDDGTATTFGGSAELLPKYDVFADYNTIIDGHGFVREYNEERSHKNMLKDHAEIKRGKWEVCLQCKSTRIAYYWDSGRTATIQSDIEVEWAPAGETFVVPAGTTVSLATDVDGSVTGVAHQVMAEVVWDGETYTTYEKEGATFDQARVWVAAYAMAVDGLPEGSPSVPNSATCNHCHDPHTGDLRLIRKELMRVIDERGVDPTAAQLTRFADAERKDRINAVCAQCHVEYVCGKSGVDGINRDFFPWAKVSELEAIYSAEFPWEDELGLATYSMDWVHGKGMRSSAWPNEAAEHPLGLPLIKSQHPEVETYWGSVHDRSGLSCADCHLPKVTRADGTTFTSHWFASPLKYLEAERAAVFAGEFGLSLDASGVLNPCGRCHQDLVMARVAGIERIQSAVYSKALEVQGLLVESLAAIEAARAAPGSDQDLVREAVAAHRSAHVRWENLVVSENSMGFHNAEVALELDNAAEYARAAIAAAKEAAGAD